MSEEKPTPESTMLGDCMCWECQQHRKKLGKPEPDVNAGGLGICSCTDNPELLCPIHKRDETPTASKAENLPRQNELKPCGFCDNPPFLQPIVSEESRLDFGKAWVACKTQGCPAYNNYVRVEKWNQRAAPSVAEGEQEKVQEAYNRGVDDGRKFERLLLDSGLKEASEHSAVVLQKALKELRAMQSTAPTDWFMDSARRASHALSNVIESLDDLLSSHAPESESASGETKLGPTLNPHYPDPANPDTYVPSPKPDKQLDADWIREAADLLHAISDAGYLSPKLTSDEQLYARLEQWCDHHRPPSYGIKPRLDAAKVEERNDFMKKDTDANAGDPPKQKNGIELIATERQRQLSIEGWTPEHDDAHGRGEMAQAALAYCTLAITRVNHDEDSYLELPPLEWPWAAKWWKPCGETRALAKAGALIAAEIDRILRLDESKGQHCQELHTDPTPEGVVAVSDSSGAERVTIESGHDPRLFSSTYAAPLKILVGEKVVYDSESPFSHDGALVNENGALRDALATLKEFIEGKRADAENISAIINGALKLNAPNL